MSARGCAGRFAETAKEVRRVNCGERPAPADLVRSPSCATLLVPLAACRPCRPEKRRDGRSPSQKGTLPMARLRRQPYTKPLPPGAVLVTHKGKPHARFTDDGRTVTAPLTKKGDRIRLLSKKWYGEYKD